MRTLAITEAEYVGEYRLQQLRFLDGTTQVVDFEPFLMNHPHPQHNKYRKLENFSVLDIVGVE